MKSSVFGRTPRVVSRHFYGKTITGSYYEITCPFIQLQCVTNKRTYRNGKCSRDNILMRFLKVILHGARVRNVYYYHIQTPGYLYSKCVIKKIIGILDILKSQ